MSDEIKDMKDGGMITDDDKLWGALSLAIPIIGLIVLFIEDKKARPFIKHAAVNGLAVAIASAIVVTIIGIIPIVGCISPLIGFGVFIYMIYLAVTETYNGEYVEIPYVSNFVREQGWV